MQIHRHNALQFYERTKVYLLKHEAAHSVIFRAINALINRPDRSPKSPYLATVEVNGAVLAVALHRPPRQLLLSQTISLQAIKLIAQDLDSKLLAGVMAPATVAQKFAQVWHNLTGQSYREGMQLRCFQLSTVQPVTTNGDLRQATAAERELLIVWCRAFIAEALPDEDHNEENTVDRLLHQGSLSVWHDRLPVSMANYTEPTPNGIGINLVYTPPEFRRHGYASACVAALSQYLLNRGHQFCFLFTDLTNPTSNRIYQTLGYQPVGDLRNYWFDYNKEQFI